MEGETCGVIVAEMASGALAHLSINWATRSGQDPLASPSAGSGLWYEMVHVCGSEGEAYYMVGRGAFVLLHDMAGIEDRLDIDTAAPERGFAKLRADEGGGHARCIAEWAKLLTGDPHEVRTSGRECRGTVEVAEAAYRSEQEGRHIALPIEPHPWRSH